MLIIGERILLTLWVGGMWITGYVVAPTLFSMLDDKATAGNIAGQLFTIISYIGMFSAVLLLLGQYMKLQQAFFKHWLSWVLLAMLVIILLGQFVLTPMMAELKAQGLTNMTKDGFGRLHAFSSLLFLVNSLLGLAVIAFSDRGSAEPA